MAKIYTQMSTRRSLLLGLCVSTALSLSGCASFHTLNCEVSTFGAWPTGKLPGRYTFDRLPSQQIQSEEQDQLEQLAKPALAAAGFEPAPNGETPNVLIQIGAKIERQARNLWDESLWIHPWGLYRRPGSPRPGPYWPSNLMATPDYQREVVILIRERATGQPLYEAHASTTGNTHGGPELLGTMISAALRDFPSTRSEPHNVAAEIK